MGPKQDSGSASANNGPKSIKDLRADLQNVQTKLFKSLNSSVQDLKKYLTNLLDLLNDKINIVHDEDTKIELQGLIKHYELIEKVADKYNGVSDSLKRDLSDIVNDLAKENPKIPDIANRLSKFNKAFKKQYDPDLRKQISDATRHAHSLTLSNVKSYKDAVGQVFTASENLFDSISKIAAEVSSVIAELSKKK